VLVEWLKGRKGGRGEGREEGKKERNEGGREGGKKEGNELGRTGIDLGITGHLQLMVRLARLQVCRFHQKHNKLYK
jgi:flagellar biosynthesis/type III secretory pathway protein FliH